MIWSGRHLEIGVIFVEIRGRLIVIRYEYRKYKCLINCIKDISNRKIGAEIQSESIARRAGLR